MHPYLFRALHIVRTADRTPYRQARFRKEVAGRPALQLAYALHRATKNSPFSAVLVAAYGLAYAFQPTSLRTSMRLAAYTDIANEKRQIDYLRSCLSDEPIAEVSPGSKFAIALHLLAALPSFDRALAKRYFAFAKRVNRRFDIFTACRLTAALAGYVRFKRELTAPSLQAVIAANDVANLHVAFNAAAQSLSIPVIFIAHAHVQYYSPRLRFALSILDGQEALELYKKKGAVEGGVLFKGVEGSCHALRFDRLAEGMTIGLFPKSRVVWPALLKTIDGLQAKFRPAQILIRWHPAMRENTRAIREAQKRYPNLVITDSAMALTTVLAQCDLCVAGNSSVHLQALRGGVPCVHVEGLDISPHDFFGFVATGIVPLFASVAAIDIDIVKAFYNDRWRERFTRYDASYLADQSLFDRRIGTAIAGILAGTRATRHAAAA